MREKRRIGLHFSLFLVDQEGNRRSDFFFSLHNFAIRIVIKKNQWDYGKLFSIGFAGRLFLTKIVRLFAFIGSLHHSWSFHFQISGICVFSYSPLIVCNVYTSLRFFFLRRRIYWWSNVLEY